MLIFRYDKTFDGLLTCLFEAYKNKRFPEGLIGEDEPVPMFAEEVVDIVTDTEKSSRVWNGTGRKLPKRVCNMLMHVWLSEEDGSDELLFRYIRKVFDNKHFSPEDFSDPDILKAHQIARRTEKERSYIMQFTRLQKAGDNTYFAAISPAATSTPEPCAKYTFRRGRR